MNHQDTKTPREPIAHSQSKGYSGLPFDCLVPWCLGGESSHLTLVSSYAAELFALLTRPRPSLLNASLRRFLVFHHVLHDQRNPPIGWVQGILRLAQFLISVAANLGHLVVAQAGLLH